MKRLIIFLFLCNSISYISAQNCLPDGDMDNVYINGMINDDQVGVIATLQVTGLTAISVVGGNTEYLEASGPNEEEEIIISLTDEFEKFEATTASSAAATSILLQVELTCGSTSATMFFTQPINDINNHEPEFSDDVYVYSLPMPFPSGLEVTQFNLEITATDIDITNSAMTFEVNSDLFVFTYDGTTDSLNKNHRGLLRTVAPLEFTSTQEFVITATDNGNPSLSTSATLIIEVDEVNSVASAPMFSAAYYVVDYEISGEDSITETSMPISDAASASFIIEGAYGDNFEVIYDPEDEMLSFQLTNPLDESDIEQGGYRPIVITATVSEMKFARTVIILNLPEREISTTPCPTETTTSFEPCEVCSTTTSTTECDCTTTESTPCQECEICATTPSEITTPCEPCDVCSTTPPTTECDCVTSESTPCQECEICSTTPSETCTTPALDCSLCTDETCDFECTDCTTEEICGTTTPTTEFDCTTCSTEDICGVTTPSTSTECPTDCDCSNCTTEEICDCQICPSTPEPGNGEITFPNSPFIFYLAVGETASSNCLSLSAISTISEEILYEATGMPSSLTLDETNGMLTNNAPLLPGVYQFDITATGTESGVTATESVRITAELIEVCVDGPRVLYSHLVASVFEHTEQELLGTIIGDDYALEILEVAPKERTDLFYTSGQNVGCYELDRESSDFEDMEVAYYTVTVAVVTNDETNYLSEYGNNIFHITGTRASTRADTSQCAIVDSIRNIVTRTVITVIIEDINDHPPIFSSTNMVIGYPERSLLSIVAPASLIQVEATDEDIGINAELAYYLNDPTVTIHSRTGVIYPTEGIQDEDFTFTVWAIDLNGNGLTSSNSLNIQVKILQQEHVSVLTFRNLLLEELDEKLSELNQLADVNIRRLQASVLPTENTRQTRADNDHYLIVTVYALDAADNLISNENLEELLDDVEDLSVDSLVISSDDDTSNNTGLIAAVSVLSVLLFLLILGFIAFYFFKVRKTKSYDAMEEDSVNTTPTPYTKNISLSRSNNKLGPDADILGRRPTVVVLSGTIGDTNDDNPPPSPPKERRKSVAFNNNVEQINIDTTLGDGEDFGDGDGGDGGNNKSGRNGGGL